MTAAPQFAPAAFSAVAVLVWGSSDFLGGLGSRRSNAFVVTAFSHLCALLFMLALALVDRSPISWQPSLLWALAAGSIGGFSLALFYRALAAGQMGLTAPIAALLGAALPTLVDIAREGAPSRWTFAGFAVAIVAIWLITRPEQSVQESPTTQPSLQDHAKTELSGESARPAGIGMAALAGVGFAGFYLCIHQAGAGSPLWIAAVSRVGSLLSTTIAVIATRAPLGLDRFSGSAGMFAGIFDISASALFIYASQHGRLDEAVVITSLYPATTVVLARIFLKEHFTRWKLVGLLAALAAVPLIATG